MSLREPWITVVLAGVEEAVSLADRFDQGWGERGISVDLPDYFDFHITSQLRGRSLEMVLDVVREWLAASELDEVVVRCAAMDIAVRADIQGSGGGEGRETRQIELPTGSSFQATFKCEDHQNGEDVGPLTLWDLEREAVTWVSSDWMYESDARKLAVEKGWRYDSDG